MRTLRISSTRSEGGLLAFLIVTGLFLLAASLFIGAAGVSAPDVFRWVSGQPIDKMTESILLHVRLPRVIAAYVCGGALALSGLLLQAALNNALASPGIIGVNAGAGFMVVAVSAVFPSAILLKLPAAFVGAVLAAMLVYGIARRTGGARMTIIMAGIAVSSLLGGGIDLIVTLRPESVMDRMSFYIGGFHGVGMGTLLYALPWMGACVVAALFLSVGLNVMQLGDESAGALGINVPRHRFLTILCAAVLAGSAVCICGLLGFVGLIVPHLMRLLTGMDYRRLAPFTVLGGGAFLLFCDTLSRVVFSPYELPVGILLSFIGAPFFLHLLLSRKKRVTEYDQA